jgi:hypothetical protein
MTIHISRTIVAGVLVVLSQVQPAVKMILSQFVSLLPATRFVLGNMCSSVPILRLIPSSALVSIRNSSGQMEILAAFNSALISSFEPLLEMQEGTSSLIPAISSSSNIINSNLSDLCLGLMAECVPFYNYSS